MADLDIYVTHYRDYRFKLGMEKLSGECVHLHRAKTDRYGHYGVGWIPFFKRDPFSLRKTLTFSVDAYIPFYFERGRIGNVNELHYLEADKYLYGYTPPDLYVKAGVFNIVKRVYRVSMFLDRNARLCGASSIEQQAHYERLVAKLKPELTGLYPLWLQYLRDNPYDISTGSYSHDKFRGNQLFIDVFGDNIRAELSKASYPNATAACEELYLPQDRPEDILLSWDACFGNSAKLDVQGDTY